MMMPQGTMFVLASSVDQLRYPQKWPIPLMTPAAQNGIQAICVMSIRAPGTMPNSMTSAAPIRVMPSIEKRE